MYLPQKEGKNCHPWIFGSICARYIPILGMEDVKFLLYKLSNNNKPFLKSLLNQSKITSTLKYKPLRTLILNDC
jgi:hypothetical protein